MRSALLSLERLLLPNSCVSCGRLVEQSRPEGLVCSLCVARLRPLPAGCRRCRQPMPPVGPCRFCSQWPSSLRWAASAVWLGDEAREIIHHLKYEGYTRLAGMAAEVMARLIPHPGSARLVPIPLAPNRQRRRGYNQASELAASLGSLWSLPVARGLIERVRETETQTELTLRERIANVAGAFVAAQPDLRGIAAQPSSQTDVQIILIDDVLTTGATISAAAAALEDVGWSCVGAVSFARALPLTVRVES